MTAPLGAPPILSTPDTHMVNEVLPTATVHRATKLSDDALRIRYEIDNTIREIKEHGWRRIALQFPDEMLPDSVRVYQMLARGVESTALPQRFNAEDKKSQADGGIDATGLAAPVSSLNLVENLDGPVKLTILADTSYGSCCVDEIAAEHVDAEVVVHYGRACLSPTARLPVVHVFTKKGLTYDSVIRAFREAYSDLSLKVVVTADVPYAHHVGPICERLMEEGYSEIFAAAIIHDPSSPVPNRTVPETVMGNPDSLKDWHVCHISEPPTSLLLTLSSRVAGVHIFPTSEDEHGNRAKSLAASTSLLLRRRYALITSLTTVSIWGILVNTLSVKNYVHMVDHIKQQIAGAGKKYYLFVVGKLNAAKVANFGEIGGWVVVGCWESSLVDSKDFYKPLITPFELQLALESDNERVWTGRWRGDFQGVLDGASTAPKKIEVTAGREESSGEQGQDDVGGDYDSEQESAPPEFDLRTGRYVSHTRHLQTWKASVTEIRHEGETASTALVGKAGGSVVAAKAVASPAGEFLRSKRTWRGLGSDFEVAYEENGQAGSVVEQGRTGIARGYIIGASTQT